MRALRALLLVPILGLLIAESATAALIYQETFDTDGAGTRYTVTGGGIAAGGNNYWARNVAPVVSPGFTGGLSTYWAGRDLDNSIGGTTAVPRAVRLPVAGVNITGYTGVTVSILLAANTGVWDGAPQPDSVRLYAVNNTTGVSTLLDTFLPAGGGSNVNLARSSGTGTQLNTVFQRFTYTIPVGIGSLGFRFEATSTGDLEWVGFDDVRIEGTVIVPEPTPAALVGLGLIGVAATRRRRAR